MSKVQNEYPGNLEEAQNLDVEAKPAAQFTAQSAHQNPELNPRPADEESNHEAKGIASKMPYYWKTLANVLIFFLFAVNIAGCIYIATQSQNLKNELEMVRATTEMLLKRSSENEKRVSNSVPVQTNSKPLSWVYFDAPRGIPVYKYDNLRQNLLRFDEIIPRSIKTKHVKFILFMANCGVTVWNDYWARLRVVHSRGQDYHYTWGISSPFGNCIWNSEMVTLNIEETREIRVQSSLILNNADLRFYFVGYSQEIV